MKVTRLLTLAGAFAIVGVAATAARANTISVTSGGVVCGAVCTYSYVANEDAGGRVSPGAAPGASTPTLSAEGAIADYFTIYDFLGFNGVVTTPAGWTFQSLATGSTNASVLRTDSAAIVNLTWYRSGATLVGPFAIAGFSAQTTALGPPNLLGQWSGEDTHNGGGTDGNTDASIGTVASPQPGQAPVPEPASLLLLGSGLIGLATRARRSLRK